MMFLKRSLSILGKSTDDEAERLTELLRQLAKLEADLEAQRKTQTSGFADLAAEQKRILELLGDHDPVMKQYARDMYS